MEAETDAMPPEPAPQLPPTITSSRDWSELPLDALSFIFTKLDVFDILMGAGLVCHSWLDAAKTPSLWRCVDMATDRVMERIRSGHIDALPAMVKLAVDRSGGQLERFFGKWYVSSDLLNYIGDRAPSLKTLSLKYCYMDGNGFLEAIKKFPLLEELELTARSRLGSRVMYGIVGQACPHLKSFKLINGFATLFGLEQAWYLEHQDGDSIFEDDYSSMADDDYSSMADDDGIFEDDYSNLADDEALGIAAMTGLHTLQLLGCELSNMGLNAILDGCPRLVSVELRQCFKLSMDVAMKARLAILQTVNFPSDPVDDYDEIFQTPSNDDHFRHAWFDHFASSYFADDYDCNSFEDYFQIEVDD